MCFHKEKRRVLTADGKSALIHKSSVNLINKDPKFSSPFFIFGEKVKWYIPLHTCIYWYPSQSLLYLVHGGYFNTVKDKGSSC